MQEFFEGDTDVEFGFSEGNDCDLSVQTPVGDFQTFYASVFLKLTAITDFLGHLGTAEKVTNRCNWCFFKHLADMER